MANPQISFQQVGIGSVLKQYWLKVPPNQREYKWTEVEVTKLFQDLAKAISNVESEYFLGTIVTIPRGEESLEVVDGQQRLATIAMFLTEVRNYLQDKDPLISESIKSFLTDIDRTRRERVVKLQLNFDDNEFFRGMILAEKDSDRPSPATNKPSNALIQAAFEVACTQVSGIVAGLNVKDHGDILDKWIRFIEHSAQVILLKVPTGVNAYRMFETLNDRGLKTTQADLVKSYLFEQADIGSRLPEAQQKWAAMRATLETLEEEEITLTFLRHALTTIRGYIEEGDVYEEVQTRAKGPQKAVTLLTKLEELATTYVATFNPEHEKWNTYPDSMRRAIQTLNLFNIRPMRPLMLAVASEFSPKEASEAFRMFITWSVRLIIASSTRSGSVIEPMGDAAHLIVTDKQSEKLKDAKALRTKLSAIIPSDELFRQAVKVATVSKAILARYYLRSLEMAAKKEATPWFIPNDDKQTINLEHVLPERPQKNWPTFTIEEVQLFVKRLGNMALLQAKSNSDLRSANFETKKAVYKDCPYELTRQIATAKKWTTERIIERQTGLAELAVHAWPL